MNVPIVVHLSFTEDIRAFIRAVSLAKTDAFSSTCAFWSSFIWSSVFQVWSEYQLFPLLPSLPTSSDAPAENSGRP